MDTAADTKEYYFFNLPKYDTGGAVVSYQVEEMWKVTTNDGTEKCLYPNSLYTYLMEKLKDNDVWSEIESILGAYHNYLAMQEADRQESGRHQGEHPAPSSSMRPSASHTAVWLAGKRKPSAFRPITQAM